ncbi:MAG: TIGR02300 family protein [Beijerinckiaceae bacterium]|nr:TIGR02300 family protein [Beijerinckiaceae bacterium]MCZ8298979.1 TIGR02300 family protein [Beijerinckiaceae bacterium]
MPKAELGTKRICPVTGKKFYDLDKDPIVSPYTGQSYPRAHFDPQPKVAKAEVVEDEELATDEVAAPELVPLEEAEETDDAKVVADDDDIDIDGDDDDTFLETEEDEDDSDVADLIDGDLEEDEES